MIDDSPMALKRHELLEDVMALVARLLREHEVGPMGADLIASAVADRLADHFGGQNISFPKDSRRKLTQREMQIFADWQRNDSWSVMSRRYGIHERTVRRIIERIRERLQAQRNAAQGDLLDPLPDPSKPRN